MTFGGGAFKAAWNAATSAAKSSAATIAVTAETVAEIAHAAATTSVRAGRALADTAVEEADWVREQTVNARKWAEKEAASAVHASARLVSSAFDSATKTFHDAVAGAVIVTCVVENALIKEAAQLGAQVLAKPQLKRLQDVLLGEQRKDLAHDGETVGTGCRAKEAKSTGTLPQCPDSKPRSRDKAVYINGINTNYYTGEKNADAQDGICKTMQKIANATCAEVTGVYNATGGTRSDISECLTNIGKDSDSPAVDTLQRSMFAALAQAPPRT